MLEPQVDVEKAGEVQKYPWGIIVLLLVSITLTAVGAYTYATNKSQSSTDQALKDCREENKTLYNNLLIKNGIIPGSVTIIDSNTYRRIADSLQTLMNKKLEDKELINTK